MDKNKIITFFSVIIALFCILSSIIVFQLRKELHHKNKQIEQLRIENFNLQIRNKIIENKVKDEILEKKIEEEYNSVKSAIDFFKGLQSDTLQR